jgi:hypothetical protein
MFLGQDTADGAPEGQQAVIWLPAGVYRVIGPESVRVSDRGQTRSVEMIRLLGGKKGASVYYVHPSQMPATWNGCDSRGNLTFPNGAAIMARRSPRRLCIQTDPRDLKPGDRIDSGHFDKLVSVEFLPDSRVRYSFESQGEVIAHSSNWPSRWDGETWTDSKPGNWEPRKEFRVRPQECTRP